MLNIPKFNQIHEFSIFIFFFSTSQKIPCRNLSTIEYNVCALTDYWGLSRVTLMRVQYISWFLFRNAICFQGSWDWNGDHSSYCGDICDRYGSITFYNFKWTILIVIFECAVKWSELISFWAQRKSEITIEHISIPNFKWIVISSIPLPHVESFL